MPTWTNYRAYRTSVRRSYRMANLKLPRSGVDGDIIWQLKDETDKRAIPRVESRLRIIDELVSEATVLFYMLSISLMGTSYAWKNRDLRNAISGLTWKITQDTIATGLLIREGFDLQAKNLTRSIAEHVEVIIYISLHPEVAKEFVNTQSEKESNAFFYKHLTKGKAQKAILARLSKSVDREELHKYFSFHKSERTFLAASHHPSYWACTAPFLHPSKSDNVLTNFLGSRSEFSFRTGCFLYFLLVEAVMLLQLNSEFSEFIEHGKADEFGQEIPKKIEQSVRLLFDLTENWNAPVFESSPEMKSFLDELQERQNR